jgi:hypothetical protein
MSPPESVRRTLPYPLPSRPLPFKFRVAESVAIQINFSHRRSQVHMPIINTPKDKKA